MALLFAGGEIAVGVLPDFLAGAGVDHGEEGHEAGEEEEAADQAGFSRGEAGAGDQDAAEDPRQVGGAGEPNQGVSEVGFLGEVFKEKIARVGEHDGSEENEGGSQHGAGAVGIFHGGGVAGGLFALEGAHGLGGLGGEGRAEGFGGGGFFEGDAGGGGEVGEGQVFEGGLFAGFGADGGEVDAVAGDAGAAGGLFFVFADDVFEAVEGIAGGADFVDHAGSHFVEFGGGLGDFGFVDAALEAFDFVAGGFDADVAGVEEFFVGFFGFLHLLADGFVFFFGLLVAEGVLAGEFFISGAEVGEDLGVEVFFFGFEGAGLADEAFAEGGVSGEALIVFGDLVAEIFFFDVEEGFRIFAFEAADEETEEAFEEIAEAFEHGKQRGAG